MHNKIKIESIPSPIISTPSLIQKYLRSDVNSVKSRKLS